MFSDRQTNSSDKQTVTNNKQTVTNKDKRLLTFRIYSHFTLLVSTTHHGFSANSPKPERP